MNHRHSVTRGLAIADLVNNADHVGSASHESGFWIDWTLVSNKGINHHRFKRDFMQSVRKQDMSQLHVWASFGRWSGLAYCDTGSPRVSPSALRNGREALLGSTGPPPSAVLP